MNIFHIHKHESEFFCVMCGQKNFDSHSKITECSHVVFSKKFEDERLFSNELSELRGTYGDDFTCLVIHNTSVDLDARNLDNLNIHFKAKKTALLHSLNEVCVMLNQLGITETAMNLEKEMVKISDLKQAQKENSNNFHKVAIVYFHGSDIEKRVYGE